MLLFLIEKLTLGVTNQRMKNLDLLTRKQLIIYTHVGICH